MDIKIRPIQPADNAFIAAIIRAALEEFGADKPGTVYYDESTDHLFELFESTKGCAYFIAEENGIIVGGAGYFATEGLPDDTCELVKMYLAKSARGKGFGQRMIAYCIAEAKLNGFAKMYLETMPELKKAVHVYEQFGFDYLTAPLGNSGHNACDIWMLKQIA